MASSERSTRSRGTLLIATAVGLVLLAVVTIEGSRAAFSSTTSNGVNSFAAGTVVVSDDDAGSVMFNLSAMAPTVTEIRCINVVYTGTTLADVKLYGSLGGSGLGAYLDTTVRIGSGAVGGATFDCTGFTPTSTLHNGTLAAFAAANTNYLSGLGGFTGASNPTTRTYEVSVTLQDDNAAQGLSAAATLTWEAQNV